MNTLTLSDLSPDQRAVYDAVNTWRNRGTATQPVLRFGGYAGCLSGDTIVEYSRGVRTGVRPLTLRHLYLKFNGHSVPGVRGISARWVDLTMPTFLHSLWPDGTVGRNRIVAVFESGVKPVLRIDFSDGQHLVLTADHPIATPSGEFIAAGELVVGDNVLGRGSMKAGAGVGRRPLDLRPPRIIVNTKYHPQGGYKAVECNGVTYEYTRVARARLVVEAAMNNLSYEEFVHALKHNAGASAGFKYIPREFDVHHVDEDTLNDDISNLEVLPHAEHARLHDAEHHLNLEYTREVKVERITPVGEEMTYDIQMEPPANNFAANGIIVHNTGKTSVVSVLAKELPSPIAFCAFTGKASSVLGRKLAQAGIPTVNRIVMAGPGGVRPFEPRPYCGTIHGLVYRPCDTCMEEEVHEHTYGEGCRENADEELSPEEQDEQAVENLDVIEPYVAPRYDGVCKACDPPPPVKHADNCPKCNNARFFKRSQLDRAYRLIIVDEASMVSDDMVSVLLSFRIPILAVGDHGQLPPVKGSGSLMRAPDLRLETIHRQAAGNPIIALSARVREIGDIDDSLEDGKHFTIESQRGMSAWIKNRFPASRLQADPMSPEGIMGTVLISWTNKTRVNLNYDVRDSLFGTDEGDAGPPKSGEVMICLKNAAPVYNGMRGVLCGDAQKVGSNKAPKWKVTVDFVEDGQKAPNILVSEHQFFAEKTIDFDQAQSLGVSMSMLGQLYDFGYALTCHKMQGSQVPEVGVYIEPGLMRVMGREDRTRWVYTAITRASDRLTVFR